MTELFPDYGVRELARLTGLSHGTISRVKRGLAADRQTMQTIYTVTGKCLCCDGIADLSMPTATADPMSAEWMRQEAIEALNAWGQAMLSGAFPKVPLIEAILTIPGPTPDDLDAAALARPKVRALVEAVKGLSKILDRNNTKIPISDVEMMFYWMAAQTVRAALADLKGGE